jgi:hypothetical protein
MQAALAERGVAYLDAGSPAASKAPRGPTIMVGGARTHGHTHESGQLLRVTQGTGPRSTHAGEGSPIGPGDVGWLAPGERHWHGAGPDTFMAHTGISLGSTDWQEPVSDEEYWAAG